jgi:hypothetical protein
MGLVTPSDFSTRLPFDFIPCEGNNLLGLGDFDCVCVYDFSIRVPFDFIPSEGGNRLGIGCVCVCVLSTRSEGRSENRFTRFLNWS